MEIILDDIVDDIETKALWVFGYGSLCWRPGFQFNKAVPGYIQGFQRRFWQGNTTHRGTEQKPGRVATLVETNKDLVYGVAFAISGEDALPYLSNRECILGGYISNFTTFYPIIGEPFRILIYIANQNNPLWLGDANTKEIAKQISETSGPNGHNIEYVLRLANFMRQHFPDYDDQHLYNIESELLKIIQNRNMCLETIMGNGNDCITLIRKQRRQSSDNNYENQERTDTFQHTAKMPEKVLRCLNI